MGDWTIPEPLRHLPSSLCVHAAQPIDFAALRGRQVAVIGAGASAFDNAATALEAGAAAVHLFCRRAEIQVIQPYRWLTFRGFLRHFCDLDDAWRWRFMRAILEMREGFPQATYDRCARHPNFHLHDGAPIEAAGETDDGVELRTPQGVLSADFVICGTGIDMNFAGRRELRNCAANIATWADRYQPPTDEQSSRLGRFPYLADDYALMERDRRKNTVDHRHSRLCHRLHHELWPLRLVDQRNDHGGAEARAWADARAVSRGHRAALGFVQGL